MSSNVQSISSSDTVHRLPVGGRVHQLLYTGYMNGNKLNRWNIRTIHHTAYHVAQAEILGLIKRSRPNLPICHKPVSYTLTSLGIEAVEKLNKAYPSFGDKHLSRNEVTMQLALGTLPLQFLEPLKKGYKMIPVAVKINPDIYSFHRERIW